MPPPTPGRPILTVPIGFSLGQRYWGTSVSHSMRSEAFVAANRPQKLRQKLRQEVHALPQRRAIIEDPRLHDSLCLANVRNVIEWSCAQNHQIGALAGFDGASFSIQPHGACRHDCRGLQRFHGRETSFDVEFHFAMNAVTGHCLIGADYNGDARAMQRCYRFERDCKPRFSQFRSRRARADISKLSRERWRYLRNAWLKTFQRSLTRPHEHLKNRQSRIDHRVVSL